MKKPLFPNNEAERLAALNAYEILDTAPEIAYDDITAVASALCGTQISLVSLIDGERQWFKSKQGIDASETPREISFCAHAIHSTEVFIVRDALQDERFADNPLVESGPQIRFYAGAPLITPEGFNVGTLCIADSEPRDISPEQIQSLQALARLVVSQLETRRLNKQLATNFQELQKYSNHIVNYQNQITESAKMAALGEMAAGMAHEINNPLAIIKGTMSLLQRTVSAGIGSFKDIEIDLEKIDSTVNRIVKIVNGLLMFSRNAERDEMIKYSVQQIVRDTFSICQEQFKLNNVKLEFNSTAESVVECRPSEISQIILNLLSNATDAVAKLDQKWVAVSIEENAQGVRLTIKDSGKGITKAIAEKMMHPFFTSKNIGKGTGLGLSIALGIAQRHHGTLSLDQTSDHTAFVLELPWTQPNVITNEKKSA